MKQDPPQAPGRLTSIDAYRGLVMTLMMGEVLRLKALPKNAITGFLAHHQEHVEWVGCTLHDLIQPSFSFLVGVALPFSLASRMARGQSKTLMAFHALWRALVLVALGIFLRSIGENQTRFTFEDTLSQIGLGYPLLFALGFRSNRTAWIALTTILVGYWAAFALYPLPGPEFDYPAVKVPPDWPHLMSGFAAHWNKNSNAAWAFDAWFLNLFPRKKPFVCNSGGYATLSFIPTLGTMILGLIAGRILRDDRTPWRKVTWLATAGIIGLMVGESLGWLGICPVVKRIWTPSWTLFSGGWCFLFLAAFYAVIDVRGWRAWSYPLVVVGANSIAAYFMAHLIEGFVKESYKVHLGREIFASFGKPYEPLVEGIGILLIFWLILFWMYRRRIFLKV